MAKCPSCGVVLDWWKFVHSDYANLMSCTRCGALLKRNRRRAGELTGVLVIMLFLPATGWLSIEWDLLWVVTIFILFLPVLVYFSKFDVITESELAVSPVQEQQFASYARKRRRLNVIGFVLILVGLTLWGADAFTPEIHLPEFAVLLCGMLAIAGMLILIFTRCPFCRTITFRAVGRPATRCMHCHREIDVSDG